MASRRCSPGTGWCTSPTRPTPCCRDGTLTAADLQALPHAAARLPHHGTDPAAAALERLGITPAVVVTTGGWLPLPFLVAGTDLVAAIPERLARRVCAAAGVTIVTITDPPLDTIELRRGRLVAPHARHRPRPHLAAHHTPRSSGQP